MPKISEFFGISIYMYYRDHGPPHFHAIYGDHEGLISIEELRLIEGRLPPRVLGLTIEWATKHEAALKADWNAAVAMEPLKKIAPLE